MTGGMASETAQMGLDVAFPETGFMTAGTTVVNQVNLGIGIAPDLFRIPAGLDVVRARPVTSLTAASFRCRALQGRSVCGLGKRFVCVFVTALADIGPDLLLCLRRHGFGSSILSQSRNA